MKFKLYRQNGALNSVPVFDAFARGVQNIGHKITESDDGIPVIWSVLWAGRMQRNQLIYDQCRRQNKPIVIIEVGNLKRGITWRISLDHINSLGEFANDADLDFSRPNKLGLALTSELQQRKSEILIACQHERSLQWQGQPSMSKWVENTVKDLRKYTDRKIIVRPHPRSSFILTGVDAKIEIPKSIPHTYDDFDIDYGYHCVINHNSGPAVQAAIRGIPVICDPSSLAYPVSSSIEAIEQISLPDRSDWFLKLCHTEWTIDEISQGIPISRLETSIKIF
jgi:hypothetical protein